MSARKAIKINKWLKEVLMGQLNSDPNEMKDPHKTKKGKRSYELCYICARQWSNIIG